MTWLLEPFALPFMQTALAAAVLVGLGCSLLGVYVVHRRMAFIGDALAHTTLLVSYHLRVPSGASIVLTTVGVFAIVAALDPFKRSPPKSA